MEEKDITANRAHETIAMQSSEDEVADVFRLHILRYWSRERQVNFSYWLLDREEARHWIDLKAAQRRLRLTAFGVGMLAFLAGYLLACFRPLIRR